jgi:hypothetical protein
MHASTYRSAALLLAAAVGCDAPALPTGPAAPPTATAPVEEEKPIVAGIPGEKLPEIAIPVTNVPRPVDPDDPIKGRRSKTAGGALGAAAHARFWGEHKIIYDRVKENLMLYMSTTGNLDFPKSNEEFMEKVIKGYQMTLPELEPQHEYIYDPEHPEVGLQIRLKPGYNADGTQNADAPAESAARRRTSCGSAGCRTRRGGARRTRRGPRRRRQSARPPRTGRWLRRRFAHRRLG